MNTTPTANGHVDMKLEVVALPVSDVDRAKRFYEGLGWRLDADFAGDGWRAMQFTPPGSPCSIHLGTGLTDAAPGSAEGLFLVVDDIDSARKELVGNGAEVSEPFQTPFGWHLAQVIERRAEAPSEERKKNAARQAIRARKADEAYQDWLRQQRDRAFVENRYDER